VVMVHDSSARPASIDRKVALLDLRAVLVPHRSGRLRTVLWTSTASGRSSRAA
jgi:hypothetical protein